MKAQHKRVLEERVKQLAALTGGYKLAEEQTRPLVRVLEGFPMLELALACIDDFLKNATSVPRPVELRQWLAKRKERAGPDGECSDCGGIGFVYVEAAAVRQCACVRRSAPSVARELVEQGTKG